LEPLPLRQCTRCFGELFPQRGFEPTSALGHQSLDSAESVPSTDPDSGTRSSTF